MKNANTRYSLKTNVKNDNLFRKVRNKDSGEVSLKKVIWYERIFDIYHPMYDKAVIGGCSFPTKEKYDQVVESLLLYNSTIKKDQFMKNANTRYKLKTNVKDDNFFRKIRDKDTGEVSLKKVIWYERIFDIIHDVHLSLAHASYARTHKLQIDKTWWGLPETAIKVYISLCPDCLSTTKVPVGESLNPLKMIISNTIGVRAQMDLIDYRRKECLGYRWILRYVDHHSGFSHVAALKRKTAKQTGRALVRIMSTAVIPEILQSDNGSEFLGKCIQYVKEFFKTVNIVKGKPRHPNEQGGVE